MIRLTRGKREEHTEGKYETEDTNTASRHSILRQCLHLRIHHRCPAYDPNCTPRQAHDIDTVANQPLCALQQYLEETSDHVDAEYEGTDGLKPTTTGRIGELLISEEPRME